MRCPQHGGTVVAVPWARHQAGHTRIFDQQISWLATQPSKSAVTEMMRIAWRTIGSIIDRVWADTAATFDPFVNLSRIGIDAIFYKRRHKYLAVVVDHDSGRLIWASPGRDKAILGKFVDALDEQRCTEIKHVSVDAAEWITTVVTKRCPRQPGWPARSAWNRARKAARQNEPARSRGKPAKDAEPGSDIVRAARLKNSRYALWKNPEDLTEKQQIKLGWVVQTDSALGRAYYLKGGLRTLFKLPHKEAGEAFDRSVSWARRSRIQSFVKLQRSIVKHRSSILASIEHGLSNGRVESMNTKITLITR